MRRSLIIAVMLLCFGNMVQGQETCATQALKSGEMTKTLQVGERERTYIRYVPETNHAEPLPLVLVFHGFASNAPEMVELTGFNLIADQEKFVVIYLQGTNNPAQWYNGTNLFLPQDDLRDMDFVTAVLDKYTMSPCIDAERVYATGFSMGGGMVHRLACEMSDRFAAYATVSGAYATIPNGCQPERGISLLTIHGLADPVVPFEGAGVFLPNIEDWLADWVARNDCQVSTPLPSLGDVTGTSYSDCKDNSTIEIYTIPDGGHTWAGTTMLNRASAMGGIVSSDINASEVIWAFFEG